MKIKVRGTTITNEMVSYDIVSGETEEPVTVRVPEIAKKVPRVPNKDKGQTNDEGSVKGREHERKQTSKDLNKEKLILIFFKCRKEKWLAQKAL